MPYYHKHFFTPPPSPWPRPDSILIARPGRLPRQSYPPQTGVLKLPVNDPLTTYLAAVAKDEMWDEWDYCWSRLAYLPRWDLEGIWQMPPGWMTPHAFLAWATWHMTVAHAWISRLYRQMRRSHSPEDLLTSDRPVSPVYQYLNKGQVERARKNTYSALQELHVGTSMYMPTPELVTYPPDGLWNFLDYIKADQNLELSVQDFEWHDSRARHKAEQFAHYGAPKLNTIAVMLKRHLGETGWSE